MARSLVDAVLDAIPMVSASQRDCGREIGRFKMAGVFDLTKVFLVW